MKRLIPLTLTVLLSFPAFAIDFKLRELSFGVSDGRSRLNQRGHSIFHTAYVEVAGSSAFVDRRLPRTEVGAALGYSDIWQARSWFGYQYKEPDDRIRGEHLELFLRHRHSRAWRSARPYVSIGTGPMWSNRRVPAATSRFNMNTQLVIGAELFENSRWPVRVGYRFSHVSNGGIASRNPGLNVHSATLSTRLRRWK